ncbi:MAG: STT3 domain-containing protein [Vicinamibacterales bacterium]
MLLTTIVALGAALRAWLPFRHVFVGGFVNFQTHDSWYHARLIDYLSRNFPHPLHADVYAAPGGQTIPIGPVFDFTVVAAARLLTLGSPSPATLDAVAAFAPVVYALVTIVAAFAAGRRMFGPLAGLLGAALLATMPGGFLDRTVLGYVDHHAAEACFSTLVLLGLTCAVQSLQGEGALEAAAGRGRAALKACGPSSAAAGLALGAYLLTWTSGSFLLFVVSAWMAAQYALDHARRAPGDRLIWSVGPALLLAVPIVALLEDGATPQHAMRLVALGGSIAVLAALDVLRRAWARLRLPPPLFVVGAGVLALAGVGALRALAPGMYGEIVANAMRLAPTSVSQTVGEAQPLLRLNSLQSFSRAWFVFRTGFFLAAPGVLLLALDVWRTGREERGLLLVWTVVCLMATIGQNRFGYYLAVELALLAGWISARVLVWAGATGLEVTRRADAAVIVVAAVVFYPNVIPALNAVRADFGVPSAWREGLQWMRASTPEPFGDAQRYWSSNGPEQPAYTVMNWWDYGYWVMRLAHRVPVANPTQSGATEAAQFFAETDETAALKILRAHHARYVLTGQELPARVVPDPSPWQRWFQGLIVWANQPSTRYLDSFMQRDSAGRLGAVMVFYPDYYRSMTMRLYQFGGAAVVPRNSTWAITFVWQTAGGAPFREITSSQLFADYDAADRFLKSLGPGNHRIVSFDPTRSPVPIAAMAGVRIAFESRERSLAFGVPAVRIFEVEPAGQLSPAN